MANLAPVIRQRFFDDNGVPLAGGKLNSYEAGTTTPLVTYSDSINTLNTNPIILDADGYCDVWISNRAYKFVLTDADDNVIWTKDNITIPQVENGFTTGDVKFSLKNVADSGWVLMDDKSIGSAASSATGRANADTLDLYTLIWNNVLDAWAPVSTGRGGSAAADFAANKTLTLPRALGRALAVSGTGSGLTARALGEYLGTQTHALTEAELAVHTHVQNSHNHTQDAHVHTFRAGGGTSTDLDAANSRGFLAGQTDKSVYVENNGSGNDYQSPLAATNQAATATNQNTGSGTAHNNMQPSVFLKLMIKL